MWDFASLGLGTIGKDIGLLQVLCGHSGVVAILPTIKQNVQVKGR